MSETMTREIVQAMIDAAIVKLANRTRPVLIYQIKVEGAVYTVTQAQFSLMAVLIASKGTPVSHEVIAEHLWPDPDKMPDNWYNVISVQKHKIGQRIGQDVILTIQKRGYVIPEDINVELA